MHLRERERDTLADISERDLNVEPDNYVLFIELENRKYGLNFECGARILNLDRCLLASDMH